MKKLLIIAVLIGIFEWIRTGYIDGLCCLWVGPALIMLEESHWDEWAKKKLEDKNDRWTE